MNTVEIKGKDHVVKYGLSSTKRVLALLGAKNISQISKTADLEMSKWIDFVMPGLETGAKLSDEPAPSRDDVEQALDLDINVYYDCLAFFMDDNTPKHERFKAEDKAVASNSNDEGN